MNNNYNDYFLMSFEHAIFLCFFKDQNKQQWNNETNCDE